MSSLSSSFSLSMNIHACMDGYLGKMEVPISLFSDSASNDVSVSGVIQTVVILDRSGMK